MAKKKKNEVDSVETGPFILKKLADVAPFFQVTVNTIKDWRKAGMPGEPRRWDLREIIEWYVLRECRSRKGYRDTTMSGGEEFSLETPEGGSEQLERGRFFTAELNKLKLQERSGELWELEDIRELFVITMLSAKASLLAFSSKLPLLLDGQEIEESSKITRAEVISVLQDLSHGLADGKAISVDEIKKFMGLMGWTE